jgi:hypothetical protein
MSQTRSAVVRSRVLPVAWIGLLAFVTGGCQSRGDVSGKVTYKGKPLVYGTVLFVGSDKGSVQGIIQSDGTYSAPGLSVGEAQVAVSSPNPKVIGSMANFKDPKKRPKPLEVPGWFAIPAHYGDSITSKLTFTVQGGSNTFDIDLQ